MGRTHPGLEEYRRKRDFSATPEPPGHTAATSTTRDRPAFVIQKHAAQRLHYDFRLEIDGVLKSWAVPKGPSTEVGEKRLAVETEDHPLDYGRFEGIIPAGHYGAGKMLIWDTGTWVTQGSARSQYKAGKITFELKGQRLQGRWNLIRTRSRDARHWLLIKGHDDGEMPLMAPRPEQEECSVVSGKTFGQLSDHPPATDWSLEIPRDAKRRRLTRLEPQIPRLVSEVPDGQQWLHELKLDGYRLLAEKDQQQITLYTRNGNDWTSRFSELVEPFAALACSNCVVDGEVVVYNADGTTDFQSLQNSIKGEYSGSRHFVAFDLLYLAGHDLRPLPTAERKRLLAGLLASGRQPDTGTAPSILNSDGIVGNGPEVFAKACDMGLEGLVSKRLDAPYRAGKNPHWVKTKCINTDEFVIGGYTEPQGSRSHFGALLLGYYRDGKLIYCGKVGTGYTRTTLESVSARLSRLHRKTSPFATRPPDEGQTIHWVKPELVAQIRFSAWTRDGRLRHPVFEALREDKPARQVGRERPADDDGPGPDASNAEAILSRVRLTSPDKVLFSEQQLTKRDLAHYYIDVADWILPHLVERPLSLLRCPSGARKACFFQRHPQSTFRKPVHTLQIDGQPYVYIDDLTGLLNLVQYGVLEIHPWGSRIDDPDRPDTLTFDLDPGPGVTWNQVIAAGRLLHNRLLAIGLQSFAKLSGGKGLHVVVPLKPGIDWQQLKTFARNFSHMLEHEYPDDFVATATKSRRHERIFIDYLRNSKGATSIACYSTRARPHAPVATPIRWNELSPRVAPNRYTVDNLRARLRALRDDPWSDYFTVDQSITDWHLEQVKI